MTELNITPERVAEQRVALKQHWFSGHASDGEPHYEFEVLLTSRKLHLVLRYGGEEITETLDMGKVVEDWVGQLVAERDEVSDPQRAWRRIVISQLIASDGRVRNEGPDTITFLAWNGICAERIKARAKELAPLDLSWGGKFVGTVTYRAL